MLFYQYVEPRWTKKEHKQALAAVQALGAEHGVAGRGRCAPEGLNCTLTGTPEAVRGFCGGLRAWNAVFNNTDFKFTDGLAAHTAFKSLALRKVQELVGYGLEGELAPSLDTHAGSHLEAHKFHDMLQDSNGPDSVVVDVRNAYESCIGHFQPPAGGAELVDPKMRNSRDFPRWLNMPETQEKLNGKRVMM